MICKPTWWVPKTVSLNIIKHWEIPELNGALNFFTQSKWWIFQAPWITGGYPPRTWGYHWQSQALSGVFSRPVVYMIIFPRKWHINGTYPATYDPFADPFFGRSEKLIAGSHIFFFPLWQSWIPIMGWSNPELFWSISPTIIIQESITVLAVI